VLSLSVSAGVPLPLPYAFKGSTATTSHLTLSKQYWGDQIKWDEIGEACGIKCTKVLMGKPEERYHLETE
jgi:hypothetical protein